MTIALTIQIFSPFLVVIALWILGGLSQKLSAFLGVFGIFLSFLASLFLFFNSPEQTIFLWPWLSFIFADFAFLLDSLSLSMAFMITGISFLIGLFSIEFMWKDAGFNRYFLILNLFLGNMLLLILANNYALLFLAWEGVGLSSYLFIGFWYEEEKNKKAAIKAFITTKISDIFLLLGIIVLLISFSCLEYKTLFSFKESVPKVVSILFFLGALGKSAQMPFHVWLKDAMQGPTPASALIHAATMVTAGVYLIVRSFPLFENFTDILELIFYTGLITSFLAAVFAVFQTDIKKMLAFSTISQIGLMFLAIGVSATNESMFHLFTHASFKALLFLSCGLIGMSFHEYDMYKLSGLRFSLKSSFYGFLVGGAALCGFPLITSGFYSKEEIFSKLLLAKGQGFLYVVFFISFLTTIYIFKAIFKIFFGENNQSYIEQPKFLSKFAIFVLAVISLMLGINKGIHDYWLLFLSFFSFFCGVTFAYLLYAEKIKFPKLLQNIFKNGFYLDEIYNFFLVKPFLLISSIMRHDIWETIYYFFVRIALVFHQYFSYFHSGVLRHYLNAFVALVLVTIGLLVAK